MQGVHQRQLLMHLYLLVAAFLLQFFHKVFLSIATFSRRFPVELEFPGVLVRPRRNPAPGGFPLPDRCIAGSVCVVVQFGRHEGQAMQGLLAIE